MEQGNRIPEKLIEALSSIALHDMCSYIDLDGNPVICDWESYEKMKELELNRFWLTKEQFEEVRAFLEQRYKGKL